MGERWRCGAAEDTGQPDLTRRGLEQVTAAHDQIDTLSQIVDDHAEPVCPVAVAVADRQVTRRRDVGPTRTGQQVPTTTRFRRPAQRAAPGPTRPASGNPPGSLAPTTTARWPPPMPRTSTACNRSRTPSRRLEVAQARLRTRPCCQGRSAGPAQRRRGTRASRGPRAAPRRIRIGSAGGRDPRS